MDLDDITKHAVNRLDVVDAVADGAIGLIDEAIDGFKDGDITMMNLIHEDGPVADMIFNLEVAKELVESLRIG